ncbi:hypothetical protein C2759_04360 [Polynucleobacter sp. MG-Unter2-18]|uniref:glycoside hydrolase family 2 TIM barrel-domain containing protein n=1 Tax=Polynucleobacter sp. MG-Unter2-18 TaxID=2081052 RepID=UPI001BFEDEC2|nr:glycoside hydrolase family 2 TIM barrel-domain containing protein [Polynucleobacter sp. MG-Unter2-18]QWD95361.1 hypothetical protein C2759_04360 [Polynucleobacter sp. MG-Unter2-18]
MKTILVIVVSLIALPVAFSNAQASIQCVKKISVQAHDRGIVVDGTLIYVKSVSYTVPKLSNTENDDIALVKADFLAIKNAGFNTIRGYEPLSPEVLDEAEDQGIFVIQALVHLSDETNFDSDDELQELIKRAQRVVARDRCRSGVILWSIWNDAPFNWGSSGGNVVERFGAPVVHQFLRRLRDSVKNADKSRPLTAANVLNAKHAEIGMSLLDVIGVNSYLGIFDWPSQKYSYTLAAETLTRILRISEKYRKPIWISETGISSVLGADPAWLVIPDQLQMIEGKKFLGFSLFQWRDDPAKAIQGAEISRDIEANWGLLTSEGKPKNALAHVSALLRGNGKSHESINTAIGGWKVFNPNLLRISRSNIFEDFLFSDVESLRLAYRIQSKGKSRSYITAPNSQGQLSGGILVRYVPEDFGAWLAFGRILVKPVPLVNYDSLIIDIGEHKGGSVNLTIMFRLTDGHIIRTPPLLLRSNKSNMYQLDLKELMGNRPVNAPAINFSEISFKLNDVANFEEVGVPVRLLINNVQLINMQ